MNERVRVNGGTLPEPQVAPDRLRRGPLRPAALASSRRRVSGRDLAARFRRTDQALALGAVLLPFALSASGPILALPVGDLLAPVAGAGLALTLMRGLGAYSLSARVRAASHLALVAGAVLADAPVALYGLAVRDGRLWAGLPLLLTALCGAHAAYLVLVRRLRAEGRLTPTVVVVGATSHARRLIEAALKEGDAAIIGVFDDRASRAPSHVHGVPVLGAVEDLLSSRLLPFIDHIVVALSPAAGARIQVVVERLRLLSNPVTVFVDLDGEEGQARALRRLSDAPLHLVSGGAPPGGAALRRARDLVLAAAVLALAAPLMALIALLIRLEDGGAVFFRQRRYGFQSEPIEVLKFRTMRAPETPGEVRQVVADDARVTRVGRTLRRYSLDELPQLWNVISGEMSLIGPRPHAIGMRAGGEAAEGLVREYAWRHRAKPGLTGWAQVNGSLGPVDTPEAVRRRVALDLEYIERWSFRMDLEILLRTPLAVWRARRSLR